MTSGEMQTCTRCGVSQPITKFNLWKGRRRSDCNSCRANTNRLRRENSWQLFFVALIRDTTHRKKHDTASMSADKLLELLIEQGGRCALTGRRLSKKTKDPNKASIDRIDCNRGYEPDNIRLVSWTVNRMRSTLTDDELLDWAQALVNHANR